MTGFLHLLTFLVLLTMSSATITGIIQKLTSADFQRVEKELSSDRGDIRMLTNYINGVAASVAELREQLEKKPVDGSQTCKEQYEYTIATRSTYIRWGRKSCEGNGTQLIYTGYAAGSHYTHSGGAANSLCLPKVPVYDEYDSSGYSSQIWGAEYEMTQKMVKAGTINDGVPCAVCEAPRPAVLMIPGWNKCHEGWEMEYNGYLVSGYHGHRSATEFVCMDKDLESLDGGGLINHNGRLFYFVVGKCGALNCPPYQDNWQITCAVCTK